MSMMASNRVVALTCIAFALLTAERLAAQTGACTYVVISAQGQCPATTAAGTAVCTACRAGQPCLPVLDCARSDSSCTVRMLARVQGFSCGQCPLGANPLPSGFVCQAGPIGNDTPTPTATLNESQLTPTVGTQTPAETETPTGGVETPTETPTLGESTPTPTTGTQTPQATDTPTLGVGTPTETPTLGGGSTPTPTGSTTATTVTPTTTGGGGTPTSTVPSSTPTRTGGTGGTATPTGSAVSHTPSGTTTPGTLTPTKSSGGGRSNEDDGCQIGASSHDISGWALLAPIAALLGWRRRRV